MMKILIKERWRLIGFKWAFALLTLFPIGAAHAQTPERWADPKLKVTDGLAVWLDASVENAARRSAGQAELKDSDAVDLWHDASGHGRHVKQPEQAARPRYRADGQLAGVRFNGQTAFLFADDLKYHLRDTTVFLVAAPFANEGGFRGFLALNATGQNDYTSGLNVDQSWESSSKFTHVNLEGPGFGGAMNLKQDATPFGRLHRLCVGSKVGAGGTALWVNGRAAGKRDRSDSTLRMDRLTLGARYYTNGGPPETRGFLPCEIAEVLIYERYLSEAERAEVDRYLSAKYGELREVPIPRELLAARPVPRVENPPPVQMLAPGFSVRELPVELTNINNVRYRDDGKLVAMAYNGKIHLLSDSDGDGLEDRVQTFWDQPGIVSPIGIALTPPGYALGQGVFIAGRERVVLVVDKDGDDRGDEVITVADGWKPLEHSVDAMGVALDREGNLYFGLGTENFTNGHLIDQQGKAHYRPDSDRGGIFKLTPDFKHRERLCSGVRFSVALAFNRAGDLFCTDQEGATWLPNGNPFDELLHIERGRHYGFPPRHPKHLNEVIDEPSVYDYGPQHQSVCGLCFNEPLSGGKLFGPAWWDGDALACGSSRGKLYRTTLVKTAHGYVADTAVLGCLNMLTIDLCLSAAGELVVCTHSGGPDWGSGPAGRGKLYKIAYSQPEAPQPVRAWALSPHEVQIAFDRPLDDGQFRRLSKDIQIECGPHVRAGDRFESFWPGYAVVEAQSRAPRKLLPVLSASMTADRRSLVLATDDQRAAVHYAVLTQPPADEQPRAQPAGSLNQLSAVELTYSMTGVLASWTPKDGGASKELWLPHLDLQAARGLLGGSSLPDQLDEALSEPGKLALSTKLDLWQMLRPAVQPGSKLDAELPGERVTVTLRANAPLHVLQNKQPVAAQTDADGLHRVEWTVEPQENRWATIEVLLTTGTEGLRLEAGWRTAEDSRERAFATRRFLLPWAQPASESEQAPPERALQLAGGDWHRGRDVFFGERAQCSKCHAIRGKGGWIGPDLSNLVHRDHASVLRDITLPSFAINPDHLAYQVLLDDGRTLTGMVRQRGDELIVGDIHGKETAVPRSSVEEMTPAQLSIMPEGLPQAIGEPGMRDLLTFLLSPEPGVLEPAPIARPGAPPPRSRTEVGIVLKDARAVDVDKLKPLVVVLAAGPKDHGPGEHDYPQWQQRWQRLLSSSPKVRVETAHEWPSAEQWGAADAVLFFSANPGWRPERAKEMDAFLARGGGLIYLHYAVNGQRAPEELARRIGLAWRDGQSRFRHGDLQLQFHQETAHPIIAGFKTAAFVDESYWNLVGEQDKVQVLATQIEEGQPRPILWTFEPGEGRVFCSLLGHYNWTFDDPLFRVLVLRALAWTTRQEIDRFNELVMPGARIGDAGQAVASPAD